MLSPAELEDLSDEVLGPVLYASSCDSLECSDSPAPHWSSATFENLGLVLHPLSFEFADSRAPRWAPL